MFGAIIGVIVGALFGMATFGTLGAILGAVLGGGLGHATSIMLGYSRVGEEAEPFTHMVECPETQSDVLVAARPMADATIKVVRCGRFGGREPRCARLCEAELATRL
ncbi:MAG: hypothetical protein H6707_00805 [Deltaproteobacteria bacterium]|nr:hypothetical protein [Deltaproteobacteria bacterium]